MIERILVPLDGSPTAEAILPQVRRILHRNDSEVLLLRTENPIPTEGAVPLYEAALSAAREYILGIRDRLERQGVKVKAQALIGPPARTILDVAGSEKATLIALATHGRSGVARALFGSVTEEVIRKSPVPVLALRPFWTYDLAPAPRTEDRPIRTILVPVDGSDRSLQAIAPVAELARLFGSRVVLLHVVGPGVEWVAPGGETGEKFDPKDLAERRLRDVAAGFKAKGVEASPVVDQGEPAEAIQAAVRFHGVDLVAMTTHGRSGVSRLVVGSVTEKVLREAKVPMLILSTRTSGKEQA